MSKQKAQDNQEASSPLSAGNIVRFWAGYFWTQIQTTIHKFHVARFMLKIAGALTWRAIKHDLSKYRWDEASYLGREIFNLKYLTYGSEEYKASLRRIRPFVESHNRRNSHHPEHYENGFAEMTFLDKVEMICDWKAATLRHNDGDIMRSIQHNKNRFGYDDGDEAWITEIAAYLEGLRG